MVALGPDLVQKAMLSPCAQVLKLGRPLSAEQGVGAVSLPAEGMAWLVHTPSHTPLPQPLSCPFSPA